MRNTERLFLIALIPFTAILGMAGHELSSMALDAQVAQAAYQCENGDERVCYKLALWTGGNCASPRMMGGCHADSMIVSNDDQRAVHDHANQTRSRPSFGQGSGGTPAPISGNRLLDYPLAKFL